MNTPHLGCNLIDCAARAACTKWRCASLGRSCGVSFVWGTMILALLLGNTSAWAQARRPTAPRLLPAETFAYFRIDDAKNFREVLSQTSLGRMARDPAVEPMVSQIYASTKEMLSEVSNRLGVTLDELITLPQGEFTIALVKADPTAALERLQKEQQDPSKNNAQGNAKDSDAEKTDDDSPEAIRNRLRQRRRQSRLKSQLSFALVLIVESGRNTPVVRRLLESSEKQMQQAGFQRSEQSVEQATMVSLTRAARASSLHYVIDEETLVLSTDDQSLRNVLARWQGGVEDERLSNNADFTTIMSHCIGTETTRPQVTYYVDPFGILENVSAAGGAAGTVMYLVQNFGLEGIKGIGGSMFVGGKWYESISHNHLLLDPQRQGVLSVVCPESGPVGPPAWVPADATGYIALNWNVGKTANAVERIYDSIRGDGAFTDALKGVSDRLNVDLQQEFIDRMSGRLTFMTWTGTEAKLGSTATVVAAQMNDAKAVQAALEKATASLPQWTTETIGGVTVYAGAKREVPESMREYVAQAQSHVALLEDQLVMTRSRAAIEQVIRTFKGGGPGQLGDSPEYLQVAGELSGQLDGNAPFMFSFQRPERQFFALYSMLDNPQMRQGLRQLAESNPVAKMFHEALEDNQLPPFSTFSQYLMPYGSFAYEQGNGLHLATFQLRKQE